jgi:Protein of unknown function (DUF1552)
MIITKKVISRREALRGMGAMLALPLLDAMVPALSAQTKTAARPINRFGVMYVPNGMIMNKWTPVLDGSVFELTPTLSSLAPYRDQLLVLSNLACVPTPGRPGGAHAKASTRFLTDISPPTSETWLDAGISVDQILAQETGKHTQLASLELAIENGETAGACDVGFACAYTNTISWRSANTPLFAQNNPRAVFERMFGEDGNVDPAARRTRTLEDGSLLDSVNEKMAELKRGLGIGDRAKLDEYFEAIRDVERRIQNAEQQTLRDPLSVQRAAGIPDTLEEHAKMMYDLFALAYQTDLTRVVTFMIGRESSGQTFPEFGIREAHHALSHHSNDPAKLEKLTKINTYHMTLFSQFIEKLRSIPDGDGSLLDHVMIKYGCGMSDGNAHDPLNLPILLVGGAAGSVRPGRKIQFAKDTPLSNLHVTMLDKFGLPVEKMFDSTGTLGEIG